MTRRGAFSAYLAMIVLAHVAAAQRGAVPLRGVVFDSLSGQPLRNAFVSLGGRSQTTTDSRGRFRFDSVTPGTYTVTAQHAVLDSIGLSGLIARTTVSDGVGDVHLGVPSFETLWRLSCRSSAPRDSGIVFGTVRNAIGGQPVANAMIELTWSDVLLDRRRKVIQRQWRIETRSNEQGGYAVCGVASQLGLRVRAAGDAGASGFIDMSPLSNVRVQRRDLVVGPVDGADTLHRGTIVGVVTDLQGHPIDGARILSDGMAEVRSDGDGRFILMGARVGTRQLEVLAIGAAPVRASADVSPRDTAMVVIQLRPVPALAPVRTTAARGVRIFAAEFNERRRMGMGYMRDSTELVRYDLFLNALRDIPSLNVQYRGVNLNLTVPNGKGGSCAPDILIDGAVAAPGHLIDLMPREVGAMEVYTRSAHIPARFAAPGIRPQCGMILVWTKYGFKNR
jgi:hypothetical protein